MNEEERRLYLECAVRIAFPKVGLGEYSSHTDLDHALENLCESPIERKLLIALKLAEWPRGHWGFGEGVEIWDQSFSDKPPEDKIVLIIPQLKIGKYRTDFMIFAKHHTGEAIPVVVECDGHDFHERTKEQAKRDRGKDRAIQVNGYPILRFTGSEIYADAPKCAAEVVRFIEGRFAEIERRNAA
jgi:very-short-patch-repair endonuclease